MRKTAIDTQKGFTLLEVLVATMVLSISVVVVLQLFSAGLDQARRARDYTRAVFHARAKMEEVLLDLPSGAVPAQGDFGDGYQWAWEILVEDDTPEGDIGVQPVMIRVSIGWGDEQAPKIYSLETLALAPLPEEPPS